MVTGYLAENLRQSATHLLSRHRANSQLAVVNLAAYNSQLAVVNMAVYNSQLARGQTAQWITDLVVMHVGTYCLIYHASRLRKVTK